jgi:nucleoside-diphosphate-sugar epimerase
VNRLIDYAEEIAGVKLERKYDETKPQGVMGRNSDNSKIKELLNWEPTTPLRVSLGKTFPWILEQVRKCG